MFLYQFFLQLFPLILSHQLVPLQSKLLHRLNFASFCFHHCFPDGKQVPCHNPGRRGGPRPQPPRDGVLRGVGRHGQSVLGLVVEGVVGEPRRRRVRRRVSRPHRRPCKNTCQGTATPSNGNDGESGKTQPAPLCEWQRHAGGGGVKNVVLL